jgi:Ca2+-binding RTX toxin-like protein
MTIRTFIRTAAVAAVAAGSLAATVPAAQAELRVGENYRMGSDPSPFRGKDTVALAVNPRNPQHIVEANANHLSQECEYTVSRDGGSTWSPAKAFTTPPPAPGQEPFVPTCRASNHLADFMFQTVEFGSGDNVYATFSTPRGSSVSERGASVLVARSADGGSNFATAVIAIEGGPNDFIGPYYELPSVAVDPGAGQSGADRVVVAAIEVTQFGEPRGDATTAVSNDGGITFSGPVQVEPPGEVVAGPDTTSPPVFLPDGSLAIAWRQSGTVGAIRVARGTVQGQTLTWSPPVTTATVSNEGSTPNTNPPAPRPSFGSSFPRMAVDQVSGNLYLVYNQGAAPPGEPPQGFQGAEHFISPDSDVYFQRSTTSGATWSRPKLINEADEKPGHESPYNPRELGVVTQTRHPDVSVAPNGRVDVVWEDRRHWYRGCVHTHQRCVEARLGDTYYAFSSDAGGDFSQNKRINDQSHNNDVGYDYRFGAGWAFGPIAVPLGNSQLLVGWMDAREGNFNNDNMDIYLAKVDHAGSPDIPQESITRSDSAGTSVTLSERTYGGGGEALLAGTFANRKGTRVVIVNEDDTAGILAAGVLARANLSQVLLSPPGGLPANVRAEVARLEPEGAYIIGDGGALSGQIGQDLQDVGVPDGQIQRLGGADAASKGRAIAEELDRRNQLERDSGMPAFNAVTVVNPDSPDAAAVAGLAAARRLPVLFVNQNSIPADTGAVFNNPSLNINKALVIGGNQVVSDGVASQLPAAERLGGADQYATSRAVVAESLQRGLPDNIAFVANGDRPMDGALMGSTVGRLTGLLMLSPGPISATAPATAASNGLSGRLDRLILLQTAAVAPPGSGSGPGPGGAPAFRGCPPVSAARNVLALTSGNDRANGTPGNDLIFAGTGDDVIDALAGDDCVDLGPGKDRGEGGPGDDLVLGGLGPDRVSGSTGNDRLLGGAGNDRLTGGRGNDRLSGQNGNDLLFGGLGNDLLVGQSGSDRIVGSRGRDRINGGRGNDRLAGESSADRISGGSGNDRIRGGSGNDVIRGASGNDRLLGDTGRDRIFGGPGKDVVLAVDGQRDRIRCGRGFDRVVADRIDRVGRDCERVRRVRKKRSRAAASSQNGVPALLRGAGF